MPARIYDADFPFLARGAHPTLTGTPITVSPTEAAKMASIDGTASLLALSGSSHGGVFEWAQPSATTLTIPTGEVVRVLTVVCVGRFGSPVTFTTDDSWIIELYDSRTGGVLGAQRQTLRLPISGSLVQATAGGLDDWGALQSTLVDAIANNALRIRMISPGWSSASAGSLSIDGLAFRVDTGVALTATRVRYRHIRSPVPGRVPARGVLAPGELGVNHADKQLYVGDGVGDPIPFLGVRLFSPDAQYRAENVVLYNREWYRALETTGPGPFASSSWAKLTVADCLNAAHAVEADHATSANTATSATTAGTATSAGSATTAATATNALALSNRAIDVLFWYIAPLGMPFPWRGTAASLPSNWRVMNGANGLPDTRGRIVEGATVDADVDSLTGSSWGGTTGGTTMTLDKTGTNVGTRGRTDGTLDVLIPNGIQSGLTDPHTHTFTVDPKRIRWYWVCRFS